jgi:vesicle coat complex subunit
MCLHFALCCSRCCRSDNPDLRDRGFVYWRLLATNPEAAKAVVLGEKPTIGKYI